MKGMDRMKISRMIGGLLLIVLSGVIAGTAFAASQKAVRPCFMSDLLGTWEMRNINAKVKIDPKDPFTWPYQRIAFDRKGDVKQVTSTTPIEGNKALIQRFNRMASTSKFTIDEGSILTITKLESSNPERCMCSYAMKDLPAQVLAKLPESKRGQIPHQGDIVLTYVNRNGQPVLIKSFRKVQP